MTTTTIDPVTLAVVQSGLSQVCNEMDLAFVRAAFSPVISEALDRSDGIYHRDDGALIEAPVALLSTSPERDDTIPVRDPFAG